MEAAQEPYYFTCLSSITACFTISVFFVSSLYIWNSPHESDHPSTIKKRFFGVFIMMFLSPLILYMFVGCDVLYKNTIWEVLGLRLPGLLMAGTVPLLLTMLLFLGPITVQSINGLWTLYKEPMYWINNLRNLVWLRNHIVAPFSEEFAFRACMLPLLLQCFQPTTAIFICPLFFGAAHLHHLLERVRLGMVIKKAILISCFQFSYTTVFGAYSAFLFWRTGHFIAPFIAHAFCNHMGFPDVSELLNYKVPCRILLSFIYLVGMVAWCLLLNPLTNPQWYSNDVFFKQ